MANWIELSRGKPSRATGGSRRLRLETLEQRYALTGFCDAGACLSIEMLGEFDTFGNQIETVQAHGEGDDAFVGFSIYDTGASVITWSANDQALFQLTSPDEVGIPIKVPRGAVAEAIGGQLIGDVSQPGVIRADGLHAIDFTGALEFAINFENPARAEGVQSFVGTANGSSQLPTITGVPIHFPTPEHTTGVAARIDMNAYEYNLGEMFPEFGELFEGLILYAPDIFFVEPGQTLGPSAAGDTTAPIRIPLGLLGGDNHANPGDEITYVENPVQPNVFFADNGLEVAEQTMLFDTGAQLSVISTEIALQLGLNLDLPTMTIGVQGAAGSTEIPGYFIDEMQMPIDNDGDGVFDGGLQFNNVPIFVLDLGSGLDGILGMNLFNTADVMLYDPFDPLGPSLQTRFFNDLVRESVTLDETDGLDPAEIDLIAAAFPTLSGNLPSGTRTFANLGLGNPVSDARIVGRHLFHNNSALDGYDPAANAADDNALDGSISPLYPGQAAGSQHVSGNAAGITGVMIDVDNLADPAAFSAADLEFHFGSSNDPAEWTAVAPESVSVRTGAGAGGSDRITVTFPAGELTHGWLQVRLSASPATGLEYDDVFYFGNQPGDVDGDGEVNASDFGSVRANPHNFLNPAAADSPYDLNRDQLVNATDLLMMRERITTLANRLNMISPPLANLGSGFVATLNRPGGESIKRISLSESTAAAAFVLGEAELVGPAPRSDESSSERSAPVVGPPLASATAVDPVDLLMAAYASAPATPAAGGISPLGSSTASELDVCFAEEFEPVAADR